jgi:hypothetical protein
MMGYNLEEFSSTDILLATETKAEQDAALI